MIDIADLAFVSLRKWSMNAKGRITCTQNYRGAATIPLGRYILGLTDRWQYADHINGDATDNRRCNLRVATPQQNRQNAGKRPGSHKYKGVYQNRTGEWCARLVLAETGYKTAEEAAQAYDRMATRYYGEFARLNQGQSAAKIAPLSDKVQRLGESRSSRVGSEMGTILPN